MTKSAEKNRTEDEQSGRVYNEVRLLEAVSTTPETTQADLAAHVGVAVGTVNWYLKRWVAKGFVTIKRVDRRRWHYLLTPQGISHKAVLARKYVNASMKLYRETRAEARRLLEQAKDAGYEQVVVAGEGEISEICRLTCLELGVAVLSLDDDADSQVTPVPIIEVDGLELALEWPHK